MTEACNSKRGHAAQTRMLAPATFLGLVLWLCLPSPARATVIADTPLEDLVAGAHAIVQGQVVRTGERARIVQGGLLPERLIWIRPQRWLKGAPEVQGALVVVHELGGKLGGETVTIEGTPRYSVGEEVIAFLQADASSPSPEASPTSPPARELRRWHTMAMALGKFTVSRGADARSSFVKRDTHALSIATWRGGQMQVRAAEVEAAMPLDTFIRFVEDIVRTLRGRTSP